LEFKQQLFAISGDSKTEFYVIGTVISLYEQKALLAGVRSAVIAPERPNLLSILSACVSAEKIPRVSSLTWSEYRVHVDVIKLKAYELLGMKPSTQELVEDGFEELIGMLSESILTNQERKQKRVELEYINSDDKLREFYQTLNSSLCDSFIAAASIHSGMVANDVTSTQNGYVEQVASAASSILAYLANPLPFAGYITSAITAVVEQAITVTQGNAVSRMLLLIPVRTQTAKIIERTSRAITIALADKLQDQGFMVRPGLLARVKKWGEDRMGVFDDLDTEYKQQGSACAVFLIKKAMKAEITAEVFASNQVVQLFDPTLSLEDFERRRSGLVASVSVQAVSLVVAIADTSTETRPSDAASGAPVSSVRTLEDVIKHTKFDYKSVLMRIEDLADAVLGKGKHKLRAHRFWYEAKFDTKTSIKRELLGFMADTSPDKVDGNLVLTVLKKYKLLGDAALVVRILGVSYQTELDISVTQVARAVTHVAALEASRDDGGAGVSFVAVAERRRGSDAGSSLATTRTIAAAGVEESKEGMVSQVARLSQRTVATTDIGSSVSRA
jgi:hypothetical protein